MGVCTLTFVVLCSMVVFVVGGEEGLAASFIFGDSLVDAGNNNFLPTLARANFRPNGIDFEATAGEPTGRYTNGRTIADIVGELLGQANYAPPFLSPNTTGKAILYGVNYASGGGGILTQTGRIFINRLGLDVQADYFNITRHQIDDLIGKSKAKEFIMRKSIFSITIGSNDFLSNYLLPVISMVEKMSETPNDFVDHLINHFEGQLKRLYSLDARKFVIGNVGPIGCIPYQKTINQIEETECAGLPNKLALQYNSKLRDLLVQLNQELPGAKFVLANVYDLVMELITNHKKYGFKTASSACCGNGGRFAGIIPCGPTSSICENRSEYVFWDPYHPSEAANLIIAKKLVDGETKYISPMNIRALKNL
ncbi:GDSL esterase/lipase At2g23540-like [Asparagus officinalis]|uniref:GDSL esterase/lipase At2g23540-like n=1 Tax=Asparagus officinalis TaxID=4686 RepID=UPI00098E3701|nr:GDSL esterase/lipase At2g23540-like [Asparagus officinalis]